MIIDAHCHAGIGSGLTAPWNTRADLVRYLRRAERAGVERTVVFPVFDDDYAEANERLARIVRGAGGRLTGFASVHPIRDAGRVAEMVGRAVETYGFRGLKVHGHDALPRREVCDAARRWRIPILVDVVGQVGVVDTLASEYPDVAFIVAHLGGFADSWAVGIAMIDQLRRWPNVYADTSGVRYFDLLVRAVREAGAGKLIFGSDGPQLHPGVELRKIQLLGLPPRQRAQVLGGTIERLLRGVVGTVTPPVAQVRADVTP